MTSKKKGSIGRQRIPMAKIQKESHRQVTFSKRRAGLFKKASELCTLCRVEAAIIVFSPAKKPFSFGHPTVDSVLDRYMSRNPYCTQTPAKVQAQAQAQAQAEGNTTSCELNVVLTQVLSELEEEKKKGRAMEEMRKARAEEGRMKEWWEAPIEEMNIVELQQMKLAVEELRNAVAFAEQSLSAMENMALFNRVNKEDEFNFIENKAVPPPYISSTFANTCNFGYGHGCFDSHHYKFTI